MPCTETNLGGTLQLLVDLKFLAGAFSPLVRGPHEAAISACRQLIVEQAAAIAQGNGESQDPLAERLDAWLDSSEVQLVSLLGHACADHCPAHSSLTALYVPLSHQCGREVSHFYGSTDCDKIMFQCICWAHSEACAYIEDT